MVEIIQKESVVAETIGRIGSIPGHIINGTVNTGHLSPDIEEVQQIVAELVRDAVPLDNLLIQLNHDNTWEQLKRLSEVDLIHSWVKYTVGVLLILIKSSTSELCRANYYNPFTHTVTAYNANPAIIRHELGHAEFFAQSKIPTVHMLLLLIPLVRQFSVIYLEFMANKLAIEHVPDAEFKETERVFERNMTHYVGVSGFQFLGGSSMFYFCTLVLGILVSMTNKDRSLFNLKKRGAEAPLLIDSNESE
jgi:hypothetical protein